MKPRGLDLYRIDLPEGGHLDARLSYPDPAPGRFAIIYVHGFGSTKTGQKAEAVELACAHRDWTCASFDFRGHGASSGSMLDLRPSGLIADLQAVHDDLAQPAASSRVGLIGSSMGGWAAARVVHEASSRSGGRPGPVPRAGLQLSAFSVADPCRRKPASAGRRPADCGCGTSGLTWRSAVECWRKRTSLMLRDLTKRAAGTNRSLVYHAQDDPVVPFHDSLAFVNGLKSAGDNRADSQGGWSSHERTPYVPRQFGLRIH